MENNQILKIKEKFPPGYKGIFKIKPLKFYFSDRFFILAIGLSFILSVVLWFYPDEQLLYIDIITKLIISIMPAMLGLSLAGFTIVISQINEKALERITNVDVHDEKDHSLYQILNAVFSVTVLAQLIPILIAVIINLIRPLSVQISVTGTMASFGNCVTLFFECMFFLYSLFSIIDLIQNIFTTGQTVNFIFTKDKIENT